MGICGVQRRLRTAERSGRGDHEAAERTLLGGYHDGPGSGECRPFALSLSMSEARGLDSRAAALALTERWNASSPVPLDSLHGLVYCAHNSPLGSTPCPQRRLRFRAHDGAGNHGQGRSLGAFFLAVHARSLGRSLVKTAILIDGAYLLKRLPRVRTDVDVDDPKPVAEAINDLVLGHLNRINRVYNVTNCIQLLYRSFYYDAWPYENKEHRPISGKAIRLRKVGNGKLSERCSLTYCAPAQLCREDWVISNDPEIVS